MITVKFFGLLSVDNHINSLTVQAGKLKHVFNEIINMCPKLSKKQLMNAILFINQKRISGPKRLSYELLDGDELVFLNPSSGG